METKTVEEKDRRQRYNRGTPQHGMTPAKMRLLIFIAECGMLTTSQVARIADIGQESAYKHLCHLFDLGMLNRIAVPYANLAPPEENGANLAFGPGENIHVVTAAGLKYLQKAQVITDDTASRKLPDYGPRNALFLAHELFVRDLRVWLELCSRSHGGHVEKWMDGTAAHLPPARPDAWFLYQLDGGQRTLVGLVEADRGTERGNQWEKKASEYHTMLEGNTLAVATGGRTKCRLLVLTLTNERRNKIAAILAQSSIASVTYVTVVTDLIEGGLERAVWLRPGGNELVPLLPKTML